MPARVITIAMSTGACAEEVGQAVADRMGYRYLNDQVVALAARKARVSPGEIDEVEHTEPLAKRIARAIAPDQPLAAADIESLRETQPSSPLLMCSGQTISFVRYQPAIYRNLIREVLWETSLEGRAVIVAHGASIDLARTPGVLRVFVTGSAEARARRLADAEHLSDGQARKHIDHTDRERAAYLRRFFGLREELPVHYDLVVNTDVLTVAIAVDTIVAAARGLAPRSAVAPRT